MSAKIMGQVWDLELPANKVIVLLALADHADHEGNNVYPSVELIAWKTGYSARQVQRIIKSLVNDDHILTEEKRPGKTTLYSIDISKGNKKPPRTPDKMSPLTLREGRHPDVTPTPDIQMSPEPSIEPSNKEPKGSSETGKSSAVNSKKKTTIPAAQMNPMKDAIVAAFGWQTETVANWGAINKTAKELCSAGYTPDNVAGIYAHVKALPYIKDFTPAALSKYAADWKSKQNNNGQRMSLFDEAVEEQRARLAAMQGGQA